MRGPSLGSGRRGASQCLRVNSRRLQTLATSPDLSPVTLAEIEAARGRIREYVRRTPTIEAELLREPVLPGSRLYLKLECLQVTGSFKARGAISKLLSLDPDTVAQGLVTASGGNHGVGVAYAGHVAGAPATVFFPRPTPPAKAEKVERWGAQVELEGEVWDDANVAALARAKRDGLCYVHPFADREVIAGQGTISLEILEDVPDIDVLVVAIGGGGLAAGLAAAAKAIRPDIRVLGVEPTGAPKILESLRAGKVIQLAQVTTAAGTLAPRTSSEINFRMLRDLLDQIVLVSDEEMRQAARWLWLEMGIAAELSGAAAVAALLTHRVTIHAGEKVCALVCGAGTDGLRFTGV
jgi:threonine dehydratase